jgi:hypothetical protein
MKFFSARSTGLLLSVVFSMAASVSAAKTKPEPVKAKAPVLTQDEVARRAITGILRDLPIDSLLRYFEDSVKASVTPENMKGFKDQIGWLPQFIGDSLDLFMTGTQVLDSTGRKAFFREYRFAAESNKRAPLIIVHLFFEDSTSPLIAGAYNKNFDNDTKNRIADAQVWPSPTGDLDVHSVAYVEFEQGILPVIRIYDADTTTFDSTLAANKGGPAVKEAIKRGYLAQIKAAKPGAKFLDRFGIAFIRRDPREGYGQYTFALEPRAYGAVPESEKAEKPKAAPAKAKTAPAKKTKKK